MFKNNKINIRRETTDVWETKNILLDGMELGADIIIGESEKLTREQRIKRFDDWYKSKDLKH
jgi:hypothetical protein